MKGEADPVLVTRVPSGAHRQVEVTEFPSGCFRSLARCALPQAVCGDGGRGALSGALFLKSPLC